MVVAKQSKELKEIGQVIMETLASKELFQDSVISGVSLSPMPEINQDESIYPYPEFKTFYDLHNQYLRIQPDPAIRNPDAGKVIRELGGMGQQKVQPDISSITQMYLLGKSTDLQGMLHAYNKKMNEGLLRAIDKVTGLGGNVSIDDFAFPDWNPAEDYSSANYIRR
jgi:multiple sugar transport system substrate-binding protein